ncbi:MAG: hypothetical protein EA419_11875 [Wenzhouxiangella sp.]|nr:MAG: hypothetical protein EA419_11875 [Wenzhouxiangella sp.]
MLDKLTIVTLSWRQIKQFGAGAIVVALILTGCASAPEREQTGTGIEAGDSASYNDREWPENVSHHLREAERSAAVGDQLSALEHLLEAARESGDAQMTQQVVAMAWRMGEWQALIEAAEMWQAVEPEAADARRLRALGLLNSGRGDDAADAMAAWLSAADPAVRPQVWRELVQILAAADEDTALEVMDQLVQDAPAETDAAQLLRARSQLKWQLDRPEEALELALQAAEQSPVRTHLVWSAQLATALDDYETALELYRRARYEDSADVTLGLSEAEVLRQLDRMEDALAVLSALEDTPDVLYSRAQYQHLAGQEAAARDSWRQLADWVPVEDADHHSFLVAWLAEGIGLKSEAADWYARVRGGPNVDRALLRRAVLLADDGRMDQARQLLILARDTEQPDLREQAWLIEAELLREAGQSDVAVELLGQALREAPRSTALLYTRAISAIEIDDLELAEQDFRQIIRMDGDNAMALNALGYTLTDRTGRHREAYRLIRRALDLQPEEPAILDSMGWVYFRLGRPETALGYLERALAGEDNPEIAAHLGEVLWHLDRSEEAQELLQAAWKRHPDDRHLADTMERLDLLP